jgi:hypothetical protein
MVLPAWPPTRCSTPRAAEVTRTVVREYFGQEILGQASPLLSGQTKWPDVTVTQLRKP